MSPDVVGIALCLIGAFIIVLVPLRHAFVPLISFGILIPMRAHWELGGLDFFSVRILAYAALAKFILCKPNVELKLNRIDKFFFAFFIVRMLVNLISVRTGESFLHPIAITVDAIGIYLLARLLIQTSTDFNRYHKLLALLCVFVGAAMLVERISEVNLFTHLGGRVPTYRDGLIRSNGPFSHSILAGTFGAVLVPIFLSLRKIVDRKHRPLYVAGTAGAVLMVVTTQSSGPLFSLFAGIAVYIFLWPFRARLRPLRWGIGVGLLVLHFTMKAPVWALINRVPLVSGSQGYHRYKLIDNFISNWRDWVFVGTDSFADWGYFMFDLSNMYVFTGAQSGLVGLVLFFLLLATVFRQIGVALKSAREVGDRQSEWLYWALGSTFFAHAISFIGVVYWDQMQLLFYTQVAFVAALVPEQVQHLKPVEAGGGPSKEETTARCSPSLSAFHQRSEAAFVSDLTKPQGTRRYDLG